MKVSSLRHASATRTALLGLAGLVLLGANAGAQNVLRVDARAPSGGDGTSWATAFDTLEGALQASTPGDHIWVAAGEYRPTRRLVSGDPRSATFRLKRRRHLFGGFDGTETTFADRAGLFARTRLSGDLGVAGDPSDNAYHVVALLDFAYNLASTLDGFAIVDGNARGAVGTNSDGGGVYNQNAGLRMSNCSLSGNRAERGGALYAQAGSVDVAWCRFFDNHAATKGGALWVRLAELHVFNSYLAQNRAERGGAVYVSSSATASAVLFENCVLYDNLSLRGGAAFIAPGADLGGGVTSASGKTTWVQCTIAYNAAIETGGGLKAVTAHTVPAENVIANSIVWRNAAPLAPQLAGEHAVEFSDVQGGVVGVGNLQHDPSFVDPARRDFRLSGASPAIDAGDLSKLLPDLADVDGDGDLFEPTPLDLARAPRVSGNPPAVDMGAYEYR